MPDYHDTPGYKPSDKELHNALRRDHEQKQTDRQDAARNNLKNTVRPGPAERLAGNQDLTPAQLEMRQKREAARAEDRAELTKPYSDRVIGRLPDWSDRGR